MAIRKPFFVRFFEGDENGGGGEGTVVEPTTDNTPDTSQDISDNPAWNDILSPVPQEFHGHLKEHLSKKDKYTQEVQQTYAPFKEFVELGVGRDDIDQSLQLAHLFQTNPRGVFDFLNTQYNYIPLNAAPTQQAPVGQNSQGQPQSEFDLSNLEQTPEFDISKDPRFQQVAQQAQLANQLAVQMQNQQIEQQVNTQLNTEITQLQTNYPHIPHQEIIKRAIANASVSGGREDLVAAAKELDGMGWFKKPGTPAPPNLSGGGNRALPSSQENIGTMSAKDRTARVAEMLRIANEGS
jgi:hypothetical protein